MNIFLTQSGARTPKMDKRSSISSYSASASVCRTEVPTQLWRTILVLEHPTNAPDDAPPTGVVCGVDDPSIPS